MWLVKIQIKGSVKMKRIKKIKEFFEHYISYHYSIFQTPFDKKYVDYLGPNFYNSITIPVK